MRRWKPFASPPEALALAGLWVSLADLAAVMIVLVAAVDLWAPPQDLPWKPLRLADPPGLATHAKFVRAAADPALCREVLREGMIAFADEPERRSGFCVTANAVRLTRTQLAPSAPVMTCPVALAYVFWERHELQPAAQAMLGERIVRVEHYGTYACRNVYGRADGRPSEHARANALDVARFRTVRGREISVAGHFRDPGAHGRFLHQVRDGGCRWFRVVLSPDYNAAHRDHLHLDFGPWRACR